MKNIICDTLYTVILLGLSLLFVFNGLGVATWQWWALFSGIFISYLLGILKGVDFK